MHAAKQPNYGSQRRDACFLSLFTFFHPMKNLTLSLGRLAVLVASACSLGACSRADYAANSRATDNPVSAPIAVQPLTTTTQAAPYVPVAAEASAVVKAPATSPASTATSQDTPAPVAATAPLAAASAPTTAAAPVAVAPTARPVAPKLNLVQRLALHKITKKIDKLASHAPQLKQRDASAARGGLDSNLRSAILFGLVGLIVLLFSSVSSVFSVVGTILLIIGLVFLVLWLLDQA